MIDYRVGDVRDLIDTVDDNSVALIASDPPFLALRSYRRPCVEAVGDRKRT